MKPNGFDFSTSAVFTHSNTVCGGTHLSNTEGEGEKKQVQHLGVPQCILSKSVAAGVSRYLSLSFL